VPVARSGGARPARRGRRREQISLCGLHGRTLHGDRVLIWLLVQPDENIPLVDAIVVIHQNPRHLPAHASGDERHVVVDESVIR